MSKVYFVGAGPGDPELITLKGKRLLESADVVIYAGSLVNPALLEGIEAEVHNSANMSLDEIIDTIKKAINDKKTVVRLHTGDTSFYSAISEQIEELKKLGIPYEVVPGVTSAAAAAASIGQELTIPEISQTVIFTRLEGRTPVPAAEKLRSLSEHRSSMVIFLSVSMIDKVVDELKSGGYPDDTPVVVVYKASWPDEKIIRGSLKDIAEKVRASGIKKTALILVGQALRASEEPLGLRSRLYDSQFEHGFRQSSHAKRKGRLRVVGIGPGGTEHITQAAREAIEGAELIVGYTKYIDLIRGLINGKEVFETGMTQEIQRCSKAIEEALKGRDVCIVCSGDPGIYAMAGLVFDLLKNQNGEARIDVEIIPGIPALSACAAVLGAPLMHDFASISLSDRLTPWEQIETRLELAAKADFVIILYNPRSKGRKDHLKHAIEIIMKYRSPETPVGIVKAATRENESHLISNLSSVPFDVVDMNTTLIIGNSNTYVWHERMITPRGYASKYDLTKST